ncbi:MAG: hypothetical protein NVS9B1_03040 [Candidatus Dormibacteraceae bacterium]
MQGSQRGQKGQAIVLVALMMSVLVGFVALALDSGRALDARRALRDSVEAAAVSAADRYYTAINTTPAQPAAMNWSQAELKGIQVFARNQRINQAASCSPALPAVPSVTLPASTTCSLAGGLTLTINVSDLGPSGQVFGYSAQAILNVALMQVLGQNPVLTVLAAALATANDQAAAPALAGLSQTGCYGVGTVGILDPVSVAQSSVNFTVYGDVVTDGDLNVSTADSSLLVAGNVLTRCTTTTSGVTYRCWPGFGGAPCSAPNVLGKLASTTYHYPDPAYQAPAAAFLSGQPTPPNPAASTAVVVGPGVYAAQPSFSSCYFLAGGVYDWQAGYIVSGGLISNELKPPDEPTTSGNSTRAPQQFWDDFYNGTTPLGSTTQTHLHCDGGFSLATVNVSTGVPAGNYAILVTSTRAETVTLPYANSHPPVTSGRESAPSMCRTISPDNGQGIQVRISNIPGAQAYNVYSTAVGGSCAGPFGYVGKITNALAESNSDVSNCPDTTAAPHNCTLGQVSFTFDGTAIGPGFTPSSGLTVPATGAYPPAGELPPYVNPNTPGSFPSQQLANQVPARAAGGALLRTGDLANENACAAADGSGATCPSYLTPGAVQMYVPTGCLDVRRTGDEYLFSGYQYNWVLHYVATPNQTCTNYFRGYANTAPIGMSYAPGTTWSISFTRAFGAPYTGGIVAYANSISGASYLVLDFDPRYAPYPSGNRLTG